MTEFKQKAYAKINLSLDVLGKRADGYHEVSMVMHQISLADTVTLSLNDSGKIKLSSNTDRIPLDEKNLAYKAAKLMIDTFNLKNGFDIFVDKKIPVAGGLAGGSTDAAAVLCLINQALNLNLDKQKLMEIGLKLGADVPYCIFSHPALAEGIGERLTKISGLPMCNILIVNPCEEVSTKEVYDKIDSIEHKNVVDNNKLIGCLSDGDLTSACGYMENVMQPVSSTLCTKIPSIIATLKELGAIHAMMSGSGATCFGIFNTDISLVTAKSAFPDYIVEIATPHYGN